VERTRRCRWAAGLGRLSREQPQRGSPRWISSGGLAALGWELVLSLPALKFLALGQRPSTAVPRAAVNPGFGTGRMRRHWTRSGP